MVDSDAFASRRLGEYELLLLGLAGSIQLVPDGTLLFHLLLVIVMVALLNATLLKPINRILEERERRTKGRLSEAETTLVAVDEKLRNYESRLKEARAEGYAQMERERAALSEDRQRRVAETKAEITRILAAETQTLVTEMEAGKAKLGAEARANALKISEQILGRSVNG
jgi:F-type H+-transporting ATPase subunit b